MYQNRKNRRSEQGNVLFLILIAVALFAALSYAVTQSTRSGGGSTEKEKATLSSASMTQGPTAMRTSLIRMVLGGVDVADLAFNSPSANFGGAPDNNLLVFHPDGGGAVYQMAPADLMTGQAQGTWFYNANWDIPDIGSTGAGGNDIIAFLPGITQAVCRRINEEFSIVGTDCVDADGNNIPDLNTSVTPANVRDVLEDTDTFPTANQEDLQGEDDGGTCNALTGQPSGCFWDGVTNGGEAVFYSVLLER